MTDNPPKTSPLSTTLVAYLLLVMSAATFLPGALSVISADLIDEFGLTRAQYGLAPAVAGLIGAFVSPATGRLADRNLRLSAIGLFVLVIAGTGLAAVGPVFAVLLAGSALAGLGASSANPVTNRIILLRTPASQIGVAVGIKQTGPVLGIFLAGLILPSLASWLGWRIALLATATLPLIALALIPRFIPKMGASDASPTPRPQKLQDKDRRSLGWLAVTSAIIAMGMSTTLIFVPLYAREQLGMTAATAGLLAAVMGIVGLVGRSLWSAFSDRFWSTRSTLLLLAITSGIASSALWAAEAVTWLAWVGAFLAGASMLSWLAVAWVALLGWAPSHRVGRHSGTQGFAMGMGFAAGPPVVGALIDAFSYGLGWAVVTGLFLTAAAFATTLR